MKFIIKNTSRENPINLLRKVSYYFQGEKNSELSFVRQIERSGYPRFHLYIKANENNELTFNLHLDQKRPVYKTAHDHAAEYEGKVIETEAERIKDLLAKGLNKF